MARLPDIPEDLYNQEQADIFSSATKGYPESVSFMNEADEQIYAMPSLWSDSDEEKKRREQEDEAQRRLLMDQQEREQMGQAVASAALQGSTPLEDQSGLPSYDDMLASAGLGDTWLAQTQDPMLPQTGFEPPDAASDSFTPTDTFTPPVDTAQQPDTQSRQGFMEQIGDAFGSAGRAIGDRFSQFGTDVNRGLEHPTQELYPSAARQQEDTALTPMRQEIRRQLDEGMRSIGAGGVTDARQWFEQAMQSDDWQRGVFEVARDSARKAEVFLDENATANLNDPYSLTTSSHAVGGAKLMLRAADATFGLLQGAHQAGIEQSLGVESPAGDRQELPAGLQTALAALNLTQPEWMAAFQAGTEALKATGVPDDIAGMILFGAGFTGIAKHIASASLRKWPELNPSKLNLVEMNFKNLMAAAEDASPNLAKINSEWRAIESGLMQEGRPATVGAARFASDMSSRILNREQPGPPKYASDAPRVEQGWATVDHVEDALTGEVVAPDTRPMAEQIAPDGKGTVSIEGVIDENRGDVFPSRQSPEDSSLGDLSQTVWGEDLSQRFKGTPLDPFNPTDTPAYVMTDDEGTFYGLAQNQDIARELAGVLITGRKPFTTSAWNMVVEASRVDNAVDEQFLRHTVTVLKDTPHGDWWTIYNTSPAEGQPHVLAMFSSKALAEVAYDELSESGTNLSKLPLDIEPVSDIYRDFDAMATGRTSHIPKQFDWLTQATKEISQMIGDPREIPTSVKTPAVPVGKPVVDMGSQGAGKAAIGIGPEFYRKEINSRYPHDVGMTAVKEIIQNSVDASRKVMGAITRISVDTQGRFIEAWDEGTGMLPSIITNEFTKLGSSSKPAGASGGLGTAKIAFLGNADDIAVVTIANDEAHGQIMTVVAGRGDDYLNPQEGMSYWYGKPFELPEEAMSKMGLLAPKVKDTYDWAKNADGTYKTGTRMLIKVRADARWDVGDYETPLEEWSKKFMSTNRIKGQEVQIEIDGMPVPKGMPEVSDNPIAVLDLPTAQVEFYASAYYKTTNGQYIDVQNNGLHQISKYVSSAQSARVPDKIIANVVSKVEAGEGGYPWTSDRSNLIDEVTKAIENFYERKLAGEAIRKETQHLYDQLQNGKPLGNLGASFYDTTGALPQDMLDQMMASPYAARLNDVLKEMHDAMLPIVQERLSGSYRVQDSRYLGFGTSSDWLGLNLDVRKVDPTASESFGVLVNPWLIIHEADGHWMNANPMADESRFGMREYWNQVVGELKGTMLHEIAHNASRDHDVPFAGALTRMIGQIHEIDVEAPVRAAVTQFGKRGLLQEAFMDAVLWKQNATKANVFQKIGIEQRVGGQGGQVPGAGAPGGGNPPGGANLFTRLRRGNQASRLAGGGTLSPGTGGTGEGSAVLGGLAGAGGATRSSVRTLEEASALPPPERGTRRFFHGTGSEFDKPDPSRFAHESLYGPAYYLTTDPRVSLGPGSYAEKRAGGTGTVLSKSGLLLAHSPRDLDTLIHITERRIKLAETNRATGVIFPPTKAKKGVSADLETYLAELREAREELGDIDGALRALDVPENLNLFDAEAPIPEDLRLRMNNGLARKLGSGYHPDDFIQPGETGHEVYGTLRDYGYELNPHTADSQKEAANEFLSQLGFDGIRYNGGKRVPMQDENGKPILHEAVALFPSALGRVRNVVSGQLGGANLSNVIAAGGPVTRAVAGATSAGIGSYVNPQYDEEGNIIPPKPETLLAGATLGLLSKRLVPMGGQMVLPPGGLANVAADWAKIQAERLGVKSGTLPTRAQHPVVNEVLGGFQNVMRSMADRRSDIRQIEDYIESKTGRAVPPQFKIWARSRVYEGRNDAALLRMQKQLQPALRDLDSDELTQLDIFYEQLDNAYKGLASGNASRSFSGGAIGQDPAQIIAHAQQRFGTRWPQMEAAMVAIQDNVDELRGVMYTSGLINKETYDVWTKEFPVYAPIKILRYMTDSHEKTLGSSGGSYFGTGATIAKTLSETGTEKERLSPLEALIDMNFKVEERARRNDIMQRFEKWGKDPLLAPFVKIIGPANISGAMPLRGSRGTVGANQVPEGFVSMPYFKDGQLQHLAVVETLHDAMQIAEPATNAIISTGLAAMSTPLRMGATVLRPSFIITNAFNDAFATTWRMTAESENPIDFVRAMGYFTRGYADEARKFFGAADTPHQERVRMAGGSIGMDSRWNRNRPDMILRQLSEDRVWVRNAVTQASLGDDLKNRMGQLTDLAGILYSRPLGKVSSAIERAPRTGYSMWKASKGATDEDVALAFRRATADFDAGSRTIKYVNRVVPFFNAVIQASAESASTAVDNPRATAGLFAGMIAATIYNEYRNWSIDPEDYQDVTKYTSYTGMVFLDEAEPPEGQKRGLWYMPVRGMPGMFIAPIRNTIRSLFYGKDAEDVLKITQRMVGALSPIEPDASDAIQSFIPPALGVGLDVFRNYDPFRQAPIIPKTLEGAPVAIQSDVNTSRTARALSESGLPVVGGHPPLMTDYLLKHVSPGPAEVALGAMDMVLAARGIANDEYEKPEPTIREWPLVGGVIGRFKRTVGSERQNQAYEQVDRMVAANQSVILDIVRNSPGYTDQPRDRQLEMMRVAEAELEKQAKDQYGILPKAKDLGLPSKYRGIEPGSPEEIEIDRARSAVESETSTSRQRSLANRYEPTEAYTRRRTKQEEQNEKLRVSVRKELAP